MSDKPPALQAQQIPRDAKFAIVAARFNDGIVEELLRGCLARLAELGVDEKRVHITRVPGAFELPVAAQWAARTKNFSAVICLGAVIRGQTPHFDFIAAEAARGIQRVALDESLPIIFGVLTTDNEQQALDRVGGSQGHAGRRAADAAVEMVAARPRSKS